MCLAELPGNIIPSESSNGVRVYIHTARYLAYLNEQMIVVSTGYKAYINLKINNVGIDNVCIDIYESPKQCPFVKNS